MRVVVKRERKRLRALAGMAVRWRVLLIGCAVAITAADTFLLGAGTGYLTSGFNGPRIDWIALIFYFLPASLLLDLWLVLGIWAISIPILRRLSPSPLQVLVAVLLVSVGLPVSVAAIDYNVHAILGNMFGHVLVRPFARAGASDMILETIADLPYTMLFVVLVLLGATISLAAAGRVERRLAIRTRHIVPPASRFLLAASAIMTLVCAVPIATAATLGSDLLYGFERKVSGHLARVLLDRVTDFDQDGFGALSRPLDPAPFDPSVYPYAIDLPGNGVDENGLAGDHPAGWQAPTSDPGARPAAARRPHLLLVYLESFRNDVLGRRTASGREVTPFLNRLAAEGRASQRAYVHSPWTLDSRSQLFSGKLVAEPGDPTLIDDFQALGYYVAHISGQDESYGGSDAILGTGRADLFYDARSDIERRTSRSTAPVSLQVSWKTVLERTARFLDAWEGGQPLFLYVNVVDTHFPYWHTEIDDLHGVPPLRRADIRASNADHVRAAYENTAANVDLAVSEIVAAFRKRVGHEPHAILVTADHGQALYERGRLGHGQTLDSELTRVPFIVWGIGGDWPEPIAPIHVRGLLNRHLGASPQVGPHARFMPDAERRVLQYAPRVEAPHVIGLQGVHDRIEYWFRGERLERVGPDGSRSELAQDRHAALMRELVWQWEAVQLESHQAEQRAAGRSS